MKTVQTTHRPSLPPTFAALNALHPLRPIRDGVDYDNAVEILDRLAVLDRRTVDQEDYLETLSTLISQYDEEHYATDLSSLSPLASLQYLMEQNGITRSKLGELLGNNRSLGGKILRGERQLSKSHIGHFCISPRKGTLSGFGALC